MSNFKASDLKKLAQTATVAPALNQCSHSVSLHDDETAAYCDAQGIVYMSYSPLCGGSNGSSCRAGSVLKIPLVQQIAKRFREAVAAEILHTAKVRVTNRLHNPVVANAISRTTD